jgi:DNA-binding protein H-NS
MKYDLDSLSRQDLEELRNDVDAAIVSLAERERSAALEAAKQAALSHGHDLQDLVALLAGSPRGKSKAKNPPKYRNPENADQTWTGRGRKPQWIKDAQANGKDIADFEI